jgi:hypothetical protein
MAGARALLAGVARAAPGVVAQGEARSHLLRLERLSDEELREIETESDQLREADGLTAPSSGGVQFLAHALRQAARPAHPELVPGPRDDL